MYFWRIDTLKAELRAGPLPQRQALLYLVPGLIAIAVGSAPIYARAKGDQSDIIVYTAEVLLNWFTIYRAYKENGGDNGIDFIPRLLSLGWVRFVRLVVRILLPFLLFAIFVLKPALLVLAGHHSQFILDNQDKVSDWATYCGGSIGMTLAVLFFVLPLLKDFRTLRD